MFLTGAFSGAGLIATDPNEVRDPPPPPTPVTFPIYEALDSAHRIGRPAQTDFQSLFSKVTKPTDISKDHSEALNVEICYPCPVDQLLPPTPDGTSYLPPLAPQDAINAASYAEATKAEPAVSRKRKEFDDRLTELRVDNDTAYRTISRLLRNGAAARLAYMRKFWEGLEGMSQYWDCSLDQYFEAGTSSSNGEQSAKRQRLEIGEDGIDSSAFTPGLGPDDSNEQKLFSANVTPELQSRTPYKGRRTHTGRDMPDQFRADTVRAFVEGTVWPFQCSVAPPRQMPTVQFGRMNLPVRQTAVVYRLPNDRTRARQGRLEGPMIAIQARDENDFVGPNDQACEAKSRLDLMRELGGLLQLAQERRREGRTELKPGEGKWWTMRPRWGGGPGGEVENETGNSDIVQVAEELLNGIRDAKGRNDKDGSKTRKKKTPAVLWKELRCGSSRWDPKIDFTAIGKDPSSQYDEVFMVSSLNHHIAILKLTVHVAYVDYLMSGVIPDPAPDDVLWCKPKLQRSQWFDLFNMEQRVEAFRGLWGVMAYLTRKPEVSVEADASDATMGGAE